MTFEPGTVRALEAQSYPTDRMDGPALSGLLQRLAGAAMAATAKAAHPAAEPAREVTPAAPAGSSSAKPVPLFPVGEFAHSSAETSRAGTTEPTGRNGLAEEAGQSARSADLGNAVPPRTRVDGRPAGGTIITSVTNYYAVPRQRVAEAPSDWAEGMAWM